MITQKTAQVLLEILNAQQVSVAHPKFAEAAQELSAAKSELEEILAGGLDTAPNTERAV